MANSVNSRCSEQKRKASQSKLSSFFTLEKRQKSDSNVGEEVESPKTSPNLPTSIDLKHRNNLLMISIEGPELKDFDFEKAADVWGAQRNRRITVTSC